MEGVKNQSLKEKNNNDLIFTSNYIKYPERKIGYYDFFLYPIITEVFTRFLTAFHLLDVIAEFLNPDAIRKAHLKYGDRALKV